MRLTEIENELRARLILIAPSAIMSRYESSEKGGRKTLGAHVSIMIPESKFRRAWQPRRLRSLFNDVYGPIRHVFVRRGATLIGAEDTRYKEIILVEGKR